MLMNRIKLQIKKKRILKNFLGRAQRAPSPDPSPAQARASPSILGGFVPSVRAAPSIHPSNISINSQLDQTLFPPPQLPGYTNGPNISFQNYIVGSKYTTDIILDCRLGEFFENPAWWPRHTGTYTTQNYCTRCFHFSPKCTKIVAVGAPPQTPLGELTALSQTP